MNRLPRFIEQTAKDLGGVATAEFWPLTPGQLLAYFDASFLFDFYNQYQRLTQKETSLSRLSGLFDSVDQIYDLLVNFACIGFKVGAKFKIQDVSIFDRVRFFEEMLELAEFKLNNEWSKVTVKKAMNLTWIKIDESNRMLINRLKTALFGLNWTWYYDVFATLGSDIYGPFKVKYCGNDYFLLINDYFNQKPAVVWPAAKKNKFERIRIFSLLKPFKYEKTVFGRYKTTANLGQLIEYVFVERDGKPFNSTSMIEQLLGQIAVVQVKQYKYVAKLSALRQVDKAILMYYWRYRKTFGKDWHKLYLHTKKNLKVFGEQFIKSTKTTASDLMLAQKRKRFDPRNNNF